MTITVSAAPRRGHALIKAETSARPEQVSLRLERVSGPRKGYFTATGLSAAVADLTPLSYSEDAGCLVLEIGADVVSHIDEGERVRIDIPQIDVHAFIVWPKLPLIARDATGADGSLGLARIDPRDLTILPERLTIPRTADGAIATGPVAFKVIARKGTWQISSRCDDPAFRVEPASGVLRADNEFLLQIRWTGDSARKNAVSSEVTITVGDVALCRRVVIDAFAERAAPVPPPLTPPSSPVITQPGMATIGGLVEPIASNKGRNARWPIVLLAMLTILLVAAGIAYALRQGQMPPRPTETIASGADVAVAAPQPPAPQPAAPTPTAADQITRILAGSNPCESAANLSRLGTELRDAAGADRDLWFSALDRAAQCGHPEASLWVARAYDPRLENWRPLFSRPNGEAALRFYAQIDEPDRTREKQALCRWLETEPGALAGLNATRIENVCRR